MSGTINKYHGDKDPARVLWWKSWFTNLLGGTGGVKVWMGQLSYPCPQVSLGTDPGVALALISKLHRYVSHSEDRHRSEYLTEKKTQKCKLAVGAAWRLGCVFKRIRMWNRRGKLQGRKPDVKRHIIRENSTLQTMLVKMWGNKGSVPSELVADTGKGSLINLHFLD